MEIVRAKDCDLKKLKKIGMACFRQSVPTKGQRWLVECLFLRYFSKSKFKKRMKNETLIYVLKKEEAVIGFYELEKDGLLASLYIDLNYQHQGCGKMLMEHAFLKAKELRIGEMTLDANESAVAFYERLGFKQTSKTKEILGVRMIPMLKKLSS